MFPVYNFSHINSINLVKDSNSEVNLNKICILKLRHNKQDLIRLYNTLRFATLHNENCIKDDIIVTDKDGHKIQLGLSLSKDMYKELVNAQKDIRHLQATLNVQTTNIFYETLEGCFEQIINEDISFLFEPTKIQNKSCSFCCGLNNINHNGTFHHLLHKDLQVSIYQINDACIHKFNLSTKLACHMDNILLFILGNTDFHSILNITPIDCITFIIKLFIILLYF